MHPKPIPTMLFLVFGIIMSACAPLNDLLNDAADPSTPPPAAQALATTSPTALPDTDDMSPDIMGATLEPVDGTVYVKHMGDAEFSEITTQLTIQAGDMVRTGAGSIARIKFTDNTESTMFENSQVMLAEFKQDEVDCVTIRLQIHIGRVFNRVNFAQQPSSFLVETPDSAASVRGTAFYTDVLFGFAENMSPQELAEMIATTAFFTQPIGSGNPLPESFESVSVAYDLANGIITINYNAGNGVDQSVTLAPNETITVEWDTIPNPEYQALSARAIMLATARELLDEGDTLGALAVLEYLEPDLAVDPEELATTLQELEIDNEIALTNEPEFIDIITNLGTTERGCGDSICDEYLGEPETCPEDC